MRELILALLLALPAAALARPVMVDPANVVVKLEKASNQANAFSMPHGMSTLKKDEIFANGKERRVITFKEPKGAVPLDAQTAAEIENACTQIKVNNPLVISCEPRIQYHTLNTPNDTYYNQLWGLSKASFPSAWNYTTGSTDISVAVVDTGVNYNHPDLSANIAIKAGENAGNGCSNDQYGCDFANNDSNPMDDNGHGSHVAGTIGGVGNNGLGVSGINWNVSIVPVKVLDSEGSGYTDWIATGINYAVSRGVKVINMSLGGAGYTQDMYDAISNARNNGVLVVCAAGNEANNNDWNPSYPASYDLDNIISVAASDTDDSMAYFSNYGASSVHIAAPGVGIISTVLNSSYDSYDGTSMASPHVAGVAALLWAYNSTLTYSQVRAAILQGGDTVSSHSGYTTTGKRLNAAGALALAGEFNPPSTSPTPVLTPTPIPIGDVDEAIYLSGKVRASRLTLKAYMFDLNSSNANPIVNARVRFYRKANYGRLKLLGAKNTNSVGTVSIRFPKPARRYTYVARGYYGSGFVSDSIKK